MRARTNVLVIAVIAATFLVPATADASHSWGNYHWERSSNPIQLDIGDNVSGPWDSHLGLAVDDWNESSVLNLTVGAGSARGRCKATSGRIEVCNGFYGNNGWLGLATISVSGDHITAGTAKMNDTYFSAAPYNTDVWRQVVMCQEIGHVFGLDHQDEDFNNPSLGTCMDYTGEPVSGDQHPNPHDYEQLATIYEHLDSPSGGGGGGGGGSCPPRKPGCNGASNGLPASDFDAPRDWGRLVRSEGRNAVYERDFGNGNRVITFVIWAD